MGGSWLTAFLCCVTVYHIRTQPLLISPLFCYVPYVHTCARRLLVLNFYPFLQKYIAPHQRDVTVIIAALVQAAHDLVPPDTLAPVLRQLVDQFVHDK